MSVSRIAILLAALATTVVAVTVLAAGGFETFVSDAATRLAYQIRDEAAELRRSGHRSRTFEHYPRSWPEGVSGPYRVEMVETPTSPRPGHRSIGVARNLTERTWYGTSYHLNYVAVPRDLRVSHHEGEPTRVTLELHDGRVLVTALD